MKDFEKGDRVVIINNGGKSSYSQIVNHWGIVQRINEFLDNGRMCKNYYISVPYKKNPNKIDTGEWLCTQSMVDIYRPEVCYENSSHLELFEKQDTVLKGDFKMELLDIYMDRKLMKLEKDFCEKEENIKKQDKDYAFLKDLITNLMTIYSKNVQNCVTIMTGDFKFSDEILLLLDSEHDKYLLEKRKLEDLVEEVMAQLKLCETYSQKENILKRYNVLTEDGKINA